MKNNKIFFVNLFLIMLLNFIPQIYAQEINSNSISSEGITTITKELGWELIYDKIVKIYEIGDLSLKEGYSATLNEKDAFRLKIKEKDYYIIVWNFTNDDRVRMIFPGERQLIFRTDDIILVDINQNNKLDIQLELKAITEDTNNISNKKASFFIKRIIEEELIPSGDYFELFDVTVRLAEEKIYTARELEAFIIFENFGEGTSKIDIVYSIINEVGTEVYRGVDSKVVQTEDRVVKDFDFLKLPVGKYILRAEIFYGQNQTGESEQDFEIAKVPVMSLLGDALFFISTIIILFFLVMFAKRFYKKTNNIKIKKGGINEKEM